MDQEHQGNLSDLWSVGGTQPAKKFIERDEVYYKFCPECGWHITGKFSTCPRCGADLRIKICPFCRGQIPAEAKICPRCTGTIG